MKTIFITSFHPLLSRNILGAPILDKLLARGDIRVVLVVPEPKKLFFYQEFDHPRVFIAGVSKNLTGRDEFFRYLALALLKTRALDIKRRTELGGQGLWLSRLLGGNKTAQRLARWLDQRFMNQAFFADLFESYSPSLVFAADIQNGYDVRLAHEAKARGIPVVGMVRSWDNIAAKGLIRAWPDLLLANNMIVKADAVRLNHFPEEKVAVVGIPHYDRYLSEKRSGREDFFKAIGGNPQKRLILYAPAGDRYIRGGNQLDRDVIDIITANLPPEAQLLVRLPPTDEVNLDGLPSSPLVYFDRPHTRYFDIRNTELGRDADRHLADTLYHADLLIAGPSTMAVDGALFDRPIILIGFDGYARRPYYESILRYYDYEHWQPVFRNRGVKLVRNSEELQNWISTYLNNPTLDAGYRRKIVEEQSFKLDGQSSQRVVEALAQYF